MSVCQCSGPERSPGGQDQRGGPAAQEEVPGDRDLEQRDGVKAGRGGRDGKWRGRGGL